MNLSEYRLTMELQIDGFHDGRHVRTGGDLAGEGIVQMSAADSRDHQQITDALLRPSVRYVVQ